MKKETNRWLYQNHHYLKLPILWLSTINVILSLTAIFFAFYSKETIDAAINGEQNQFLMYAIIIGSIMLINLLALAANQYYKVIYKAQVDKKLKDKLFKKLMKANYTSTHDTHSGTYMTLLESDVDHIAEGLVDMIPRILFYMVRFLGAFVLLFLIDELFAILLLGFGLVMLLSSRFISKPMKKRHHHLQSSLASSKGYLQESIENITVIKAFEAEDKIAKVQDEKQEIVYHAKKHKNNLSILISSGLNIFFAFGYAFAIIFGAWRLQYGLSVGSLLAMIQLVQHVQSPFSGISMLIPKYYQMMASTERVITIDQLEEETKSNSYTKEQFKSLICDKVYFAYDHQEVITNLSFTLNKGEILHLKGDSGKGKTTFFKLLLGLYQPNQGMMYIQNDHLIGISPETRSFFSYVPQQHFILSGTIRDNLNLYQTYDDGKLYQVLDVVSLYEDLKYMPKGLDSVLGERGKGLSEGQIQRLAIARALLKDAPVLLLDEVTSSLDQGTEEIIMSNIKKMTDKTVIVISHRPIHEDIVSKTIQFQ